MEQTKKKRFSWLFTGVVVIILGGWILSMTDSFSIETGSFSEDSGSQSAPEEIPFEIIIDQDVQSGFTYQVPAQIAQWIEKNRSKPYQGIMAEDGTTYILLTRGESASSGYEIEVEQVLARGKTLLIEGRYIDPQPGQMELTMLTYPVLLLSVDGHYTEAEFKIREE